MPSHHPHRAASVIGVVALTSVIAAGPAGDAHGAVAPPAAPPTALPRIVATDGGGVAVIGQRGRHATPVAATGVRQWSPAVQREPQRMLWPAKGRVTSEFGPRGGRLHAGIDIAAPTGTKVRTAASGRVTFSGWKGGYGRTVIVGHGGGTRTLYGHLSSARVSVGDRVARGARIGAIGSTGRSTGPHLHFEVRDSGKPGDPRDHLATRR